MSVTSTVLPAGDSAVTKRSWGTRGHLTVLLGLVLFTGCNVGPDYVPPKVDMPDAWHLEGLTRGKAQLESWWTCAFNMCR